MLSFILKPSDHQFLFSFDRGCHISALSSLILTELKFDLALVVFMSRLFNYLRQ
jgi:hypothetical protein